MQLNSFCQQVDDLMLYEYERTKEKETRVKLNPGLSTNRPLNN